MELISDGIHIHPSVVRATFKMFGPDVLRALFGVGQKGALQVDARQIRAGPALPLVGRRRPAHLDELLLQQGHARGTDLGHAPAQLVLRHGLEPGGVLQLHPNVTIIGDEAALSGLK